MKKKNGTSLENLKLHGEPTENHSGEEAQCFLLAALPYSILESVTKWMVCDHLGEKERTPQH